MTIPMRAIVDTIVSRDLAPEAQKRAAAAFARARLADAIRTNRQATGRQPNYEQIIDGRRGAPLEAVNLPGRIVFLFDGGLGRVFEWIGEMLVRHSPVATGEYQRLHRFFAGGIEIEPGAKVPPADEYVFVSAAPYARKIERGVSDQAPDGVYEAVATLARQQFGDVASIRFSYRAPGEFGISRAARSAEREARTPAIVITGGR